MTENGIERERQLRFCAGFGALLFTVASEYALCAALAALYRPAALRPDYAALFCVPEYLFRPEPLERLQYVCVVLALPFLVYGWYAAMRRTILRAPDKLADYYPKAAYLAVILGALWLLAALNAAPYALRFNFLFSPAGFAAAAAFAALFYRYGEPVFRTRLARNCAAGVLAALLVCVFVLEIFGPQVIDSGSQYGMHFAAVFHPVVEVYSGKSLLAPLVSQYGLYPFFLNFLFALTGLSVLKFTLAMAALSVAAYLCIFAAFKQLAADRAVAAVGTSVILFYGMLHYSLVSGEHYFQAVPLRLIMPAAGTLLAFLYFYKRSRAAYCGCGLLCAVAVLWNFDTGAVLFAAWLLSLAYSEIAVRGWRGAVAAVLKHVGVNVGLLAAVALFFACSTRLKSGLWPDFSSALAYTGYFYGLGFNMVPMTLLHTWNITALLYAGGLLYAAIKLHEHEPSPSANAIFYLSVLGCGLFAYFQGRSLSPNLFFVSWPAVFIAAAGTQRLFAVTADCAVYRPARAAASAVAAIAVLCAISAFAQAVPLALHNARRRILPALVHANTPAMQNIAFVREHSRPGQEAIVLSYDAAVFQLYGGVKNPLNIPSLAEIYLNRDIDAIAAAVAGGKYPVFRDETAFSHHTDYARKVFDALRANYHVAAKSPAGLLYCLPNSASAENHAD